MIGATILTVKWDGFAVALIPLLTGLLSAFVVYGRWRLMPLGAPSRSSVLGATT